MAPARNGSGGPRVTLPHDAPRTPGAAGARRPRGARGGPCCPALAHRPPHRTVRDIPRRSGGGRAAQSAAGSPGGVAHPRRGGARRRSRHAHRPVAGDGRSQRRRRAALSSASAELRAAGPVDPAGRARTWPTAAFTCPATDSSLPASGDGSGAVRAVPAPTARTTSVTTAMRAIRALTVSIEVRRSCLHNNPDRARAGTSQGPCPPTRRPAPSSAAPARSPRAAARSGR